MSEDDGELKKIIIPPFMKALCKLDDEVNRGERKRGNTFTIAEVLEEAPLKASPLEVVAKIIRGYRMIKDPFLDVDTDDKVTLTSRGRPWCSEPDEAELFLVEE
jgi:hypothetical protein